MFLKFLNVTNEVFMKQCCVEYVHYMLMLLCSNKTDSQIISMEFNVLDSLNASMMRPVSLYKFISLSVCQLVCQ